MNTKKARVIAFFLPQFHPIPENDEWWGKGFTEWTNVGKAKPLFKGHYQPRVPADLGYYDLRVPEVREAQAVMAREAGVEGFCYWHYWFGNGKRLLERPLKEVLESGKPDFPFCLGWANDTWSGIWHGDNKRVLIEQKYPGIEDYEKHFYEVLPYFLDHRYIKVDNKCLFYIYRPFNLPDNQIFIELWQNLAIINGLKGVYFVGQSADKDQAKKIENFGYDGVNTRWDKNLFLRQNKIKFIWNKVSEKFLDNRGKLNVWDYGKIADKFSNELDTKNNYFPTILSGWDNSPRSGSRGLIYKNYEPKFFDIHVNDILSKTNLKEKEKNIIFLRSWNEWAEGNYLEPDLKYGHQFLNILKKHIINE